VLTDARQVRVATIADGLWVRPLDPAAMLAARRYDIEVDTVLEVNDRLFGDARYRLQGGPDGADCQRTDATPDVTLSVTALGSTYLGGTRLQTLARAGLATADDPAALARLDRALLTDRLPLYGTAF
jgi:predicted acetyltransferase